MQENFSQAMNMLHTTDLNTDSIPPTQQANNITTDSKVTNAQLFTFLKTLQNKVDRLENNKPSTHIETTSTISPRTGKYFKHYCFSCGCCPHWRKHCPTKKSGHKNDATFKNRMGGSNENCMPNRT